MMRSSGLRLLGKDSQAGRQLQVSDDLVYLRYNKDRGCHGYVVENIEAIDMTLLGGALACAKRAGPTSRDSVRVDPETMKCPESYQACSDHTDKSETVCVENLADCPIIDMFTIQEDAISEWKSKGFEITEKGLPLISEDSATYIAFAKNQTRDGLASKEPILNIVVSTERPCFGPQSDMIQLTRD